MDNNVETNSLKAWLLASRPKTCAAAVAPVIVGWALGARFSEFKLSIALCCLLFAVLMQIAANLINDLYDFLKGSDGEDRLGPKRATAQGWITPGAMKIGIAVVVGLACCCGMVMLASIWKEFGWDALLSETLTLTLVGLACVLFAYSYTSGPFPLAYNGLGDVAVVIFFGVIATGVTAYVQTLEWYDCFLTTGIAVGMTVDALLVLNNYRDRETDEKAGKRTTVVRCGEKFGRYLYLLLGIAAVILSYNRFFDGALVVGSYVSSWMNIGAEQLSVVDRVVCLFALLLPMIYLLPHYFTWRKMTRAQGEQLNSLIGETSRNMLLFAISLSFCIGIVM